MKHLLTFALIVLFGLQVQAQRGGGNDDKVESLKIGYISSQLNLEPSVAERFWPVYHQYEQEMKSVVMEKKRNNDNRSVDDILDQEQKALDIKKKYTAAFLKIISNNQVAQLYKAEKEFRRMILKRSNR